MGKTAAVRLEEAYATLGIKPEEVAAAPHITPILEQSFKKGVEDAVLHLKASADKDAKKFLETWRSFSPTMHKQLPFEAFCLASGVGPKRILEVLVSSCYENANTATQLIASVNQPKVVAATVKGALNVRYGSADRKMLHLSSGFVPVPKSQTTIFGSGSKQLNQQNNVQNNLTAGEHPALEANKITFNPNTVYDLEAKMNKITDKFNSRMGLLPEVAGSSSETNEPDAETIEVVAETIEVVVETIAAPAETDGWD